MNAVCGVWSGCLMCCFLCRGGGVLVRCWSKEAKVSATNQEGGWV